MDKLKVGNRIKDNDPQQGKLQMLTYSARVERDNMTIIVPFPPSLHKSYITKAGSYKRIRTEIARNYIETVQWTVKKTKVMKPYPFVTLLQLRFYWPDNRTRDYDNHAYLIMNGLKGTLLVDDSWKNIGEKCLISGGIDAKNPRVEVTWVL